MSEPLDAITQSRLAATIAAHARPRAADRPCVATTEIAVDLTSGERSICTTWMKPPVEPIVVAVPRKIEDARDVRRNCGGCGRPFKVNRPAKIDIICCSVACRTEYRRRLHEERESRRAAIDDGPAPDKPRSRIIWEVAKRWRVKSSDVVSQCRQRRFVRPRHVAMKLLEVLLRDNRTDIGRFFDRDHSSVVHGIDKVDRRRIEDPDYARRYLEVEAVCRAALGIATQGDNERTSA